MSKNKVSVYLPLIMPMADSPDGDNIKGKVFNPFDAGQCGLQLALNADSDFNLMIV